MKIFIKSSVCLAFSSFILGCAHAPSPEEATQSTSLYDWHDGSTGGLYGIGEGWWIKILSAEYVTVTMVTYPSGPQPELITVPAEYEWVKDETVGPQSEPEMAMQFVTIPETYRTLSETIVIKPERTSYDITLPVYSADGKYEKPATVIEIHEDAITRQKVTRVLDTPERKIEKLMPVEHRVGYRRVLKSPARTLEEKILPKFYKSTDTNEVKPWRFIVSNSRQNVSHTFENYGSFRRFTDSLK